METKGERIFFTTTARDCSGSCNVAVSQAAALALSGLDTMSEPQQANDARAVSFSPFGNCRIMRWNELSKTPDSAKKCRILDGHPSGESLY